MPDITDQILNRQPYRYADSFIFGMEDSEELSLIAARFLNTEYDLDNRPHWDADQLDECILEIKQSLMDWVSAGLIAKWVTRYRMWQKKFSSWKDFCLKGLGKDPWKVKKLIEHAEIVVELAKEGFEVLPSNQSQVEKLRSCAEKLGCWVGDAWDRVIGELPDQLITANAIAETLGFASMNTRMNLPKKLVERLCKAAHQKDMTTEELHQQILDGWLDAFDGGEDELTDSEEVAEPEPEAIEAWETDLKELVAEHEGEIWLLCTLTKLANFVTRSTNQFSWLRQYRSRTT